MGNRTLSEEVTKMKCVYIFLFCLEKCSAKELVRDEKRKKFY